MTSDNKRAVRIVLDYLHDIKEALDDCLTALALGVTLLYVRTNSLIVQNRVIRLEERLRLERLLPADLQPRIPELSLAQLVALRFASDAELADLTRQVLDGTITEKDEIKKRVKNWRADWLRV